MLCLDTFIPSGALDNIPHTINKTMDIPVTLLRNSPEMIVRQHDSGKKRTVKRDRATQKGLVFTKRSV